MPVDCAGRSKNLSCLLMDAPGHATETMECRGRRMQVTETQSLRISKRRRTAG
jgi:hypothetical protein